MPVWLVGRLPKPCGRSGCSVRTRLCSVRARLKCAEVGMWVLSLGETPDAWKVGVYPGRDWMSVEDGCSPDEGI